MQSQKRTLCTVYRFSKKLLSYQEKAKILLPLAYLFIRGTTVPVLLGKLKRMKKFSMYWIVKPAGPSGEKERNITQDYIGKALTLAAREGVALGRRGMDLTKLTSLYKNQ